MPDTEEILTFTDTAGHKIAGILSTPGRAATPKHDSVAVLCHGFLSNKNSATNKALTALLVPQGIATFRFDFFGHGESAGPFEDLTIRIAVSQAISALDLVYSRGYRKVGLVGSSFGGLVAVLAAGQLHPPILPSRPQPRQDGSLSRGPGAVAPATSPAQSRVALRRDLGPWPEPAKTGSLPRGRAPSQLHPPAPGVIAPSRPEPAKTGSFPGRRAPSEGPSARSSALRALALKCPVSDFAEMLRGEFDEKTMAKWRATGTIPNVAGGDGRIRLPFSFYEECTRSDAYQAARAVDAPTLIIHGDYDEYVPLAQSRRLAAALSGKASLLVLPGADHFFSTPAHFREMTTLISQWMVDHLNIQTNSTVTRRLLRP